MRWPAAVAHAREQLERAAADVRRGAVAADQEASDLERAAAQATVALMAGPVAGPAGWAGRGGGWAGRAGWAGGWAAVSGQLGYDVAALGVLLGALEAVRDERLPAGPWSSSPAGRQAAAAVDVHRRAVAALGAFTDLVGAVLHGDPLGRYRAVALDPADLGRWALHHGGQWATVTDPFLAADDTGSTFAVVNARMVAATLTPEHVRELLDGDGAGARPLVRYLATLRSDAGGAVGVPRHPRRGRLPRPGPRDVDRRDLPPRARCRRGSVARAADDVLAALAGLWALDRAAGRSRTAAWDAAVAAAPVYGASRLLEAAAGTPGAATADELSGWGAAAWRGLVGRRGPARVDRSRGDRRSHPLGPRPRRHRRRGASCSTWPVAAIVARSSRCWPTTSPARP